MYTYTNMIRLYSCRSQHPNIVMENEKKNLAINHELVLNSSAHYVFIPKPKTKLHYHYCDLRLFLLIYMFTFTFQWHDDKNIEIHTFLIRSIAC